MKQVQAVVNAVAEILGDSFTEGSTVVRDVITDQQKIEVREIVFNGILSGDVEYKKSLEDEVAIKRYVSGMVDNHFRKSQLLNGGAAYKPSSTGTKRDPQLRELNRLLKTVPEDSEDFYKVQEHIESRESALAGERAAQSLANSRDKIDASLIPSHLTDMLNADS